MTFQTVYALSPVVIVKRKFHYVLRNLLLPQYSLGPTMQCGEAMKSSNDSCPMDKGILLVDHQDFAAG